MDFKSHTDRQHGPGKFREFQEEKIQEADYSRLGKNAVGVLSLGSTSVAIWRTSVGFSFGERERVLSRCPCEVEALYQSWCKKGKPTNLSCTAERCNFFLCYLQEEETSN